LVPHDRDMSIGSNLTRELLLILVKNIRILVSGLPLSWNTLML
jgi:hypothetical protein